MACDKMYPRLEMNIFWIHYQTPYYLMWDFKNITVFLYLSGWILTVFDLASLTKTMKIHPSGNHAVYYRQRVWDFIYLTPKVVKGQLY